MKTPEKPQSTTSLPRAPRDEADARFTKYLITMGIRIACFILMVVITPYGWYTWVLGAAAIVLPYVAVVLANVGQDARIPDIETPERAIESSTPPSAPRGDRTERPVIRVEETRRTDEKPSPGSERGDS